LPQVTFKTESGEAAISAQPGEKLLDLARKANVAIDAPCSGNGSCGKCRVSLVSGETSGEKSRHLTDDEFASGWRLACGSAVADGDVTVYVPDVASAYKSRLLTTDMTSPQELALFGSLKKAAEAAGFGVANAYSAVTVTVAEPTLDDTMPDNERVARALSAEPGIAAVTFTKTALTALPDALRDGGFTISAAVRREADRAVVLGFSGEVYGLAIDVGTTTVSALLVNLATGAVKAKSSSGNGQIRFGADVINRIVEQRKPGGAARLRDAVILETLNPIIADLCGKSGTGASQIVSAVIAGNTTMEHLLLGIPAQFLRTEPYVPAFFRLEPLSASDAGLNLHPNAEVALAPNIGSYVGGDITAGTLASMLWNSDELTIFVDLGTNGEIVFGNSEFLMSCACSAGPAFEGGDIKCGMRAATGAIEGVVIDRESTEPSFETVGGGKPVGICGSGLIDTVAELFTAGIIDGRGKFCRDSRRVARDEYGAKYVLAFADETETGREIFVDETDLASFIRTKGAIFSAIRSLTVGLGFTPLDADRMLVAGGIGSGINIKNAIRIGMFPALPEERFTYIGNSSLMGAYLALTSGAAAAKLGELSRAMTYVELSSHPGYMDEFVAACFLPHTDIGLFTARSE
jgi:uncharacterized 2Fe-2S/4Fe-4S cluster protein (DUF4445 family)